MTNKWRGEVEITLNSQLYTLRPTFESLCKVENQLGTGLLALARKLASGLITLEELVTIITNCSLTEVPPDELKQSLVANDLSLAIETVAEMFSYIFMARDEK